MSDPRPRLETLALAGVVSSALAQNLWWIAFPIPHWPNPSQINWATNPARPIAGANSNARGCPGIGAWNIGRPKRRRWVTSEGAIGEFDLMFLFFQAGFEFEFNQDKIGTAPLRLGAVAWPASLGLTGVFIGLLYIVELVRAPLLVGLVLPTTSSHSYFRQTGDLESDFGRYVLGAAAIGLQNDARKIISFFQKPSLK